MNIPNSKAKRICQLPKVSTISGRSSSITNAFINAILPVYRPSLDEELEALAILEMTPTSIRCAYCGDRHTEWDHLRPIIRGKQATKFITEIANLVPSCGKCNQSKGGTRWKDWMLGPAAQSPKTRGVENIEDKVRVLEMYEKWRKPVEIDFEAVIESRLWEEHQENLRKVLAPLQESQVLAKQIRILAESSLRQSA